MSDQRPGHNVYEVDAEDTVRRCSCPCCEKCWIFIWSKANKYGERVKNGLCICGGPFDGFDRSEVDRA